MLLGFLLVVLSFYFLSFSSFHTLLILLFVEFIILVTVILMLASYFSWFSFIMLVLVGVCLGACGISLMLYNSRSKGLLYFYFI